MLILLERSIDFAMPLHHSPIYQSLLHDLLGLKSNHVEITSADSGKKQIFLDHENDEFWRQNAQQPLPKVHDNQSIMLSWYTQKKNEIKKGGGNINSNTPSTDFDHEMEEKKGMESGHDALKSVIRSMPQLLKKKEEIDRHQQLMSTISSILDQRSISEYFHLEEALMHSKILDSVQSKSLHDQLSSRTEGSVEDKLRLFLIYYLCHHDVTRSELSQLLSKLLTNGGMEAYVLPNWEQSKHKLKALQYVVEHKKLLNLGDSLKDAEEKEQDNRTSSTLGSLLGKGQALLTTVRGMLPTSGNCTVTRIAKLLMNTDVLSSSVNILSTSQSNPHLKDINKNYTTFDPLLSPNDVQNLEKINFQQYDRSIVFVVGGGCYSEYANLMEFARNKQRDIIYGATDLVAPNDFLKQLSNLGPS